jgi:hypothetical protein
MHDSFIGGPDALSGVGRDITLPLDLRPASPENHF